jgi:hypothetical protein
MQSRHPLIQTPKLLPIRFTPGSRRLSKRPEYLRIHDLANQNIGGSNGIVEGGPTLAGRRQIRSQDIKHIPGNSLGKLRWKWHAGVINASDSFNAFRLFQKRPHDYPVNKHSRFFGFINHRDAKPVSGGRHQLRNLIIDIHVKLLQATLDAWQAENKDPVGPRKAEFTQQFARTHHPTETKPDFFCRPSWLVFQNVISRTSFPGINHF